MRCESFFSPRRCYSALCVEPYPLFDAFPGPRSDATIIGVRFLFLILSSTQRRREGQSTMSLKIRTSTGARTTQNTHKKSTARCTLHTCMVSYYDTTHVQFLAASSGAISFNCGYHSLKASAMSSKVAFRSALTNTRSKLPACCPYKISSEAFLSRF